MSETGSPRCCFEVFTLFPAAIDGFVGAGLLGKAIESGRLAVHTTDFRDFARDRHRTVDDSPFGGGAGMVIKPGPVVDAMEHVERLRGRFHRIVLTPSAPRFDQRVAARLAELPRIGLLCGRYEGIDDRVREHYADECLSLGDFVLGGGEVAALTIIEAVSRLIDGVIGNPESVDEDSFGRHGQVELLEHPHYTRPAEFRGHAVPPVLLGGDHHAIERWRRQQAIARTWSLRPELRPQGGLAAEHPVHLVVPPDALADAAELAEVARAHRVAGLAVLGAPSDALPAWLAATGGRVAVAVFEQARAFRRRVLRGRDGKKGCVVRVAARAEAGAAVRGPALVDQLTPAEGGTLGPIALWLGADLPPGLETHAVYAPTQVTGEVTGEADRTDLTSKTPADPGQRLASAGAIADISPPRSRTAVLANAALTGLRDRG